MKFKQAYTIAHTAMRSSHIPAQVKPLVVSFQKQIVVLDQARINGKPDEIPEDTFLCKSLRELEHDMAIHARHEH